jgi:hypothetical protein
MRIDDPARINAYELEATAKSRQRTERSGEASLERARLEQAVALI